MIAADASTYGKSSIKGVQHAAWHPSPSPEITLTYVRSYAIEYEPEHLTPQIRSACSYGERVGPYLYWEHRVTDHEVTAVWIDGQLADTGPWLVPLPHEQTMEPDPVRFTEATRHATTLRIVTSKGKDITFDIAGFYDTPVQENIEYCGQDL